MTDANADRPLTRRELRERERAAEAARSGAAAHPRDPEVDPNAVTAPPKMGRHSIPSVPAAPEERAIVEAEAPEPASEVVEAEVVEEPAPQQSAPSGVSGFGKLFGKKRAATQRGTETQPSDAPAPESNEPAPTQAIDQVAARPSTATSDGEAAADASGGASRAATSVPAPSLARPSSLAIDDVQGLDTVDDASIDDIEIDEVAPSERPVSAARVSESTPAELEDRRIIEAEELDEPTQAGPSRGGAGRLPFIVNVVEDTSEHHIADLRQAGAASQGGGPSSSSITANALVLPAGPLDEPIAIEGTDGVLVTGSIDVPEGFATAGRGRAAIDGTDLDAEVENGELQNPDAAPVRASKAVSSYANARVQIAPKQQRSSAWPIVAGVGAGAFVAAVGGLVVFALSQGWF